MSLLMGRKNSGTGVISSGTACLYFTGPFQALRFAAAPLHLREPE